MAPVLFQIGELRIHSFGALAAVALLWAALAARAALRRAGMRAERVPVLVCAVTAGAVAGAYALGASLAFVIRGAATPALSSAGALAGGGAAAIVLARAWRIRIAALLDALCPAAAGGEALVRVGCHLAGDGHWGPPAAAPWGVRYLAAPGWAPDALPVHPTPLYEALAAGVVLCVLRRRGRSCAAGVLTARYLVGSGAGRLLLGELRCDPAFAGLTAGQWAGLAMLGCGAACMVFTRSITRVEGTP